MIERRCDGRMTHRGLPARGGSAIRIVPLVDDADLLAATPDCLVEPLDLVVVTTAIGYWGWIEAANI